MCVCVYTLAQSAFQQAHKHCGHASYILLFNQAVWRKLPSTLGSCDLSWLMMCQRDVIHSNLAGCVAHARWCYGHLQKNRVAFMSWAFGGTEKEMASFACLTVKRQRAVKTDLSVLLFFRPLLSFAVTLLTAAPHSPIFLVLIQKPWVDPVGVAFCMQNWHLISSVRSWQVCFPHRYHGKGFNEIFWWTFILFKMCHLSPWEQDWEPALSQAWVL